MTREMNKPDWHNKWQEVRWDCPPLNEEIKPKERVLDDWIKPFFDNCCRMEKLK